MEKLRNFHEDEPRQHMSCPWSKKIFNNCINHHINYLLSFEFLKRLKFLCENFFCIMHRTKERSWAGVIKSRDCVHDRSHAPRARGYDRIHKRIKYLSIVWSLFKLSQMKLFKSFLTYKTTSLVQESIVQAAWFQEPAMLQSYCLVASS